MSRSSIAFAEISIRSLSDAPDVRDLLGSIDRRRGRPRARGEQASLVLARLAARARFDSTVAANATAGVALPDVARAVEVMRTTSPRSYRDGSEGEFAGYRDALDHVVREAPGPLDVPLLAQLHRMLLRHTGDSGAGVPAGAEKQRRLAGLLGDYEEVIAEGRHPPLLPICALAHELVSMRPFERGSGRIARLLTTRELLRHGYRVAKYVSLEQRIFETLGSYEAVLAEDGEAPREDPHDLTPWARYLLGIVDGACDNLEHTIATGAQLAGATKRAQARDYILTQAPARFPLGQIDEALPDISKATIRDALEQLCAEGRVAVDRGPGAMWRLIA